MMGRVPVVLDRPRRNRVFGPGGGPSARVTQYSVSMRGVLRQAQAGCLVLPVTGYTNGEFRRCWLAGGSGDDVP